MAKVRGSAILTRVAYVKDKYGEDGWKRLQMLLSPQSRQVLASPIENRTWHPFETFIDLNVRADSLFGRGDYRLCVEMGAYGADKNLNTVYRIFFQLGSVPFIMSKAASLWNEHYDSGKLISNSDQRKSLTLHIQDFVSPHCAHCFSVMGWAGRSIELTGASVTERQRTSCRHWRDATCTLSFRTT